MLAPALQQVPIRLVLRSLGGRWITWKAAQGREAHMAFFGFFSREKMGLAMKIMKDGEFSVCWLFFVFT